MNEPIENPLDDIFTKFRRGNKDSSLELFTADDSNIDLKTDIIFPEDVLLSTLKLNDDVLYSSSLEPLFSPFIASLLRHRVSLDRKSRSEFVQVNTRPLPTLNPSSEFKSISEARK